MSDEKRFNSYVAKKSVKFLGFDVEIRKLSTAQALEVQGKAKALVPTPLTKEEIDQGKQLVQPEDKQNFQLVMYVIQSGCDELGAYTEEELFAMPMEDLTKLSEQILEHSGLSQKKK